MLVASGWSFLGPSYRTDHYDFLFLGRAKDMMDEDEDTVQADAVVWSKVENSQSDNLFK